jgi:MFS family permease
MILGGRDRLGNINKSNFILFLISHGTICLGDSILLVATTLLIFDITKSGLWAGFNIIFTPVMSILLSPFAGSFGEGLNSKNTIAILNIARAFAVMLIVDNKSVWSIYLLLIIYNAIAILINPPMRKLTVTILENKELLLGNSLINGVGGIAYLVGPIAAGILVEKEGAYLLFIISSLLFAISGLTILLVKTNGYKQKRQKHYLDSSIMEGLSYYKKDKAVRKISSIYSFLYFTTSSINIAFYAYVFNTLCITKKEWGYILSIFYGTNIISMLVSIAMRDFIKKNTKLIVYLSMIIMSIPWIVYGNTHNTRMIFPMLIVEGSAFSSCTILLVSYLQQRVMRRYIARVTSIIDIIISFSKIGGIAFSYLILAYFEPSFVFIINSIAIFVFTLYKLLFTKAT